MAHSAPRSRAPQATDRDRHNLNTSKGPQHTSPAAASAEATMVQRTMADPGAASPEAIQMLQRTAGNRAVSRHLAETPGDAAHDTPRIQFKLTVGPAADEYEQEADHVAGEVMRMPDPAAPPAVLSGEETDPGITPLVQREVEPPDEMIQALPAAPQVGLEGGEAGKNIESRLGASRGAGNPLPDGLRSFMEPRFGADFSGVRVHTGSEPAHLNRQLSAQAFTHGSDIYLGAGKYNPGTQAGQRLLAHELTHVVQQGGGKAANLQSKRQLNRKPIPPANVNQIQRLSIGDHPNIDFSRTTSVTLSVSGAEGVYFFHEGKEFAAHSTVVVKPSSDPVSQTMAMKALQAKVGGGRVPKTIDGTGYKTAARTVLDQHADWTKAYNKKVQELTAKGDQFGTDPIMQNAGTFKTEKMKIFDDSPTLYVMGLAGGEEFKDIVKKGRNPTATVLRPSNLKNLGKVTAGDIFMGNFDRVISANFGNWMVDAKNRIHLIDNFDAQAAKDLAGSESAEDYWKGQDTLSLLATARLETTASEISRRIFKNFHMEAPEAGFGSLIGATTRPSKKNPNEQINLKPGELGPEYLSVAEKYVMQYLKQGLQAGRDKILKALAPNRGWRSRSLKGKVVKEAGQEMWDALKQRAQWLKSLG